MYIEGGRTPSGFFTVEKDVYPTRLFRASVNGNQIIMQSVPVAAESLDPRFVFLLDAGMQMFVWAGRKSRVSHFLLSIQAMHIASIFRSPSRTRPVCSL